MRKAFAIMLCVTMIFSLSLPVFAEDTAIDPQKALDISLASDITTDKVAAASEAKDTVAAKVTVAAFKGNLADQLATLKTLQEEAKGLWDQIKAADTSIKKAQADLKTALKTRDPAEAKKLLTDLKTALETTRAKVNTIHTDIKALREKKDGEWKNLRAAVKERDETKAKAALTNIISLKSQIIAKQKELLPLKQQILVTVQKVK